MSGIIFISYRRGEDAANARLLHDRLNKIRAFRKRIFFDVESLRAGHDYVRMLQQKVDGSDVLLAIIGPNWLTVSKDGKRRLDDPDDFVRFEIGQALAADKLVFPILVEDAAMPSADMLPDVLKPLARREMVQLSHKNFDSDCARLIASLKRELAELDTAREAAKRAGEAEASEREAQSREELERKHHNKHLLLDKEREEVSELIAGYRDSPEERAVSQAALLREEQERLNATASDRERAMKAHEEQIALLSGGQAARNASPPDAAPEAGKIVAKEPDLPRTAPVGKDRPHPTPLTSLATDEIPISGHGPIPVRNDDVVAELARLVGPPGTGSAVARSRPPAERADKQAAAALSGPQPLRRRPSSSGPTRRALIRGGLVTAAAGVAAAATSSLWLPYFRRPVRQIAPDLVLSGHVGRLRDAGFHPAGNLVVTASEDRTARIWKIDGTGAPTVLQGHTDTVNRAMFAPDRDSIRVLTASDDYSATIIDGATVDAPLKLEGHTAFVKAAAWSPDGKRVVTGGGIDGRLWEASTGLLISTCPGHTEPIQFAAYSPDGQYFATTSDDNTVRIWHASLGGSAAVLEGHERLVVSAEFTSDSANLVTASWDGTARQWRAWWNHRPTHEFRHENWVTAARYSPDAARIVTASFDRTACVWEAPTGDRLVVLSGHAGELRDARFSPDGRFVVTASHDQTAGLWNASTGAQLAVLAGHEESVEGATFSPDGSRVLTWSADSTARIWTVPEDIGEV